MRYFGILGDELIFDIFYLSAKPRWAHVAVVFDLLMLHEYVLLEIALSGIFPVNHIKLTMCMFLYSKAK